MIELLDLPVIKHSLNAMLNYACTLAKSLPCICGAWEEGMFSAEWALALLLGRPAARRARQEALA